MEKRVLILTGTPGSGKTTILEKTVGRLKERGIRVGGMISREAREGKNRVGFEILDISSCRHGWLAHVSQKTGPQVGKYRVNLNDLDSIGAQSVIDSLESADVVVVDEIGPMELFSGRFKAATKKALESDKPLIVVVHFKARDRIILQLKARDDAEVFVVTETNRETLPEALAKKSLDFLKRKD